MSDLINISYGAEEEARRKTSINIFSIESVEVEQGDVDVVVWVYARVIARLEQRCLRHGNVLGAFQMETRARAMDELKAMHQCIQHLLTHDYRLTKSYNFPKCDCDPSFDRIHYDFSGLSEPWRSLFEELFKDSSWSIQKLLDNGNKPIG